MNYALTLTGSSFISSFLFVQQGGGYARKLTSGSQLSNTLFRIFSPSGFLHRIVSLLHHTASLLHHAVNLLCHAGDFLHHIANLLRHQEDFLHHPASPLHHVVNLLRYVADFLHRVGNTTNGTKRLFLRKNESKFYLLTKIPNYLWQLT